MTRSCLLIIDGNSRKKSGCSSCYPPIDKITAFDLNVIVLELSTWTRKVPELPPPAS